MKPYFKDECNHGKKCYVGSKKYQAWSIGELEDYKIDVYIFTDSQGQQVCIRYGDEPHEYVSPGSVCSFLLLVDSGLQAYSEAYTVLRENGTFKWERY